MNEKLTAEELAEHMAKIKQDPRAWAFTLACGVMQWTANFGMMSAKRRVLRGWIVAVQASLLAGLVDLHSEPIDPRWREHFEEAERTLAEHRLDDAEIQATIKALQEQLQAARAVAL